MFSVNQSKCIHLVCISGNFKSKQSLRADKQQRGLTRNNQCSTKHFYRFSYGKQSWEVSPFLRKGLFCVRNLLSNGWFNENFLICL